MFNMAQKNLYLPKIKLIYRRILSARLTKIKARLIGTTTITVPKTKLFKKAYSTYPEHIKELSADGQEIIIQGVLEPEYNPNF